MLFKISNLRIQRNRALLITLPIVGIGLFLSGFYQGTRQVQSNETESLANQYVRNYVAAQNQSKGFAIPKDVIAELNDYIEADTLGPQSAGFQIYYGQNGAKNYMVCVPLLPTGKEKTAPANTPALKFIPIIEVKKLGDLDLSRPCPLQCSVDSKVGNNQ